MCQKLDAETYPDENVVKTLNESFVCVKLDGEKNKELMTRFHAPACPSIAFVDGDGELVHLVTGFLPPAKFVEMLAVPTEERKKFDELKEDLAKAPDDPKLNYGWAVALFQRGRTEEGSAALDKVLALDPEDKAGLADDVELARVELLLGDGAFTDAEAALETFREKRAASDLIPKALLFLGVAQMRQNRFDDGIATWKQVVEKFPNATECKHAKSMIAHAEKKKRELQREQGGK